MAVFVNSRHRRSLLGNRGRPKENRFGEDRQGVGLSRKRKGLRRERGARAEGAQRESKKKEVLGFWGFLKNKPAYLLKKPNRLFVNRHLLDPEPVHTAQIYFSGPIFLFDLYLFVWFYFIMLISHL